MTLITLGVVWVLILTGCVVVTPASQTAAQAEPGQAEQAAAEAAADSAASEASEAPIEIIWWSHWANEPAKRLVIEKIAADYEAEHPNVNIEITWWDKNPLIEAVRNAMTAGEGAPDITSDFCAVEHVQAGWCLDLADVLPWENFAPGTELDTNYASLGYPGNYKFNIGASTNMIFYNKEIFAELGIEVPDDYQFTQSEFLDVVQKCHEAGYAGVADAIGNRPYPGVWAVQYPLFTLVGPEEYDKYNAGLQSWDTPEARQVLEYSVQLRDAGLWPESFATMTIDEFHVYFHTQRQACMLFVPSWYAGRAFKPVEEGGQDPNWHFGMLRYPLMDGAKAPTTLTVGFESGYHVLSSTQHPEVAKDILAFASQPKYGALWTAVTDIPSVINYDPATDWPSDELLQEMGVEPGKWDWYWEEYNKVYGGLPTGMAPTPRCGDFENAVTSALNEGLPLGLISVDEAIQILDENLCVQ
jgi:ABC-type glycerol-3-phosphate transport system substrate-binding protein